MIRLELSANFLRRFDTVNIIFLIALMILGYLLTARWQVPLSIFVGGVLALINFRSLKKEAQAVAEAVASGERSPGWASRTYLFKYYLRLVATAIVLFFVIKLNIVHPLPLLVGISVVLLNILLCFLRELGRNFWLKLKEG